MKEKFKRAYIDVAHRFAQLSSARKMKVGCIIVKNDRIISIGYNGMPSGWTNNCEKTLNGQLITKPEVLHAEANAITKVARSSESCEGASLFVTHTPCLECAKLIYQSGVKEVYYKHDFVSNQRGMGAEFLTDSKVKLEKITEV